MQCSEKELEATLQSALLRIERLEEDFSHLESMYLEILEQEDYTDYEDEPSDEEDYSFEN